MKSTSRIAAALIFLLFAIPAVAQKIQTEDGIPVVFNDKKPRPPKGTPSRLVLTEDFSVGISDNIEESVSDVTFCSVDDDGNIYALDIKENNIKVYDASGNYVRTIGKKGQGPGELNTPVGLHLLSTGEIMVEDALNRRLSYFSPDGTFIRNVSTADRLSVVGLILDPKGGFAGRELTIEEGRLFWHIRSFDEELKNRFELDKVEFQNPLQQKINPFDLVAALAFDQDGNLYYGGGKDYEIRVFDRGGKPIRIIRKKFDPADVTEEDIQRMLEQIPNVTGTNFEDMFEFPKKFPPFQSITVDEAGRLVVRTYTKGKKENAFILEVFDPEGRFIASLDSTAGPLHWRGGKMYSVEENEDGFRVIKRYSVSWKD